MSRPLVGHRVRRGPMAVRRRRLHATPYPRMRRAVLERRPVRTDDDVWSLIQYGSVTLLTIALLVGAALSGAF